MSPLATSLPVVTTPAVFSFQGSSSSRPVPGGLLRRPELLLRDHQGDHPGAAELVPRLHRGVAVAGSDHDLVDGVDGVQPPGVHPEEAVHLGGELNLALLDGAPGHVIPLAEADQPLGGGVLMDHAGDHLPDI